jgi:hypothetical protein
MRNISLILTIAAMISMAAAPAFAAARVTHDDDSHHSSAVHASAHHGTSHDSHGDHHYVGWHLHF